MPPGCPRKSWCVGASPTSRRWPTCSHSSPCRRTSRWAATAGGTGSESAPMSSTNSSRISSSPTAATLKPSAAGSAPCSRWREASWSIRLCFCSTSPRPASHRNSRGRSGSASSRCAPPTWPWWSSSRTPARHCVTRSWAYVLVLGQNRLDGQGTGSAPQRRGRQPLRRRSVVGALIDRTRNARQARSRGCACSTSRASCPVRSRRWSSPTSAPKSSSSRTPAPATTPGSGRRPTRGISRPTSSR